MKHIILSIALALGMAAPVMAEDEAPKTKKVCIDIKDKEGKTQKDAKGNVKQSCKEVKIHKKLEGKEVPNQKK
jgi:hypothetical protein